LCADAAAPIGVVMSDRQRRGLIHLAMLVVLMPIAYLVGLATDSVRAFELSIMVGLVVNLVTLGLRRASQD
jgi:hypothetical protein